MANAESLRPARLAEYSRTQGKPGEDEVEEEEEEEEEGWGKGNEAQIVLVLEARISLLSFVVRDQPPLDKMGGKYCNRGRYIFDSALTQS